MSHETIQTPVIARDAVRHLGAEIARLSERLFRLEEGIEALCQASNVTKSDALLHLQEIDILVQSSETLASYAKALAEQIDGTALVEIENILASLPLRDVAARLVGKDVDISETGFELL